MAYRPKISAPQIVGRPSEGHVVLRRPINVVPRSGPPNSKLSQEERLDEALAIAKKSVALDHLDALRFTHGRALLAQGSTERRVHGTPFMRSRPYRSCSRLAQPNRGGCCFRVSPDVLHQAVYATVNDGAVAARSAVEGSSFEGGSGSPRSAL